MSRASFLLLFCLSAAAAETPAPTPMLAWGDDPPATEVRALSGSRTVVVAYGSFDPATFDAELDGDKVTLLFHPEAGSKETVELPLLGGANHLVLQVSSADGSQHIMLERVITLARMPGDDNASTRAPSLPEIRYQQWKAKHPERSKDADNKGAASEPASAPATQAPPPR